MGWAWTMNPAEAQKWMKEYLNCLKGGKTVAQARAQFIVDIPNPDSKLLKVYGKTGNVIDLEGQ